MRFRVVFRCETHNRGQISVFVYGVELDGNDFIYIWMDSNTRYHRALRVCHGGENTGLYRYIVDGSFSERTDVRCPNICPNFSQGGLENSARTSMRSMENALLRCRSIRRPISPALQGRQVVSMLEGGS